MDTLPAHSPDLLTRPAPAPFKLTPMFEQYLRIKGEYPNALLFYRMGDFYELFFEDAEIAARELQITLTCRNPNQENPVPMCGVPHHAATEYLSQLLSKGFNVAICEQVEDPKTAKGLVRREVTRVLTPGTLVEDENLVSKEHAFLAALFWDTSNEAGGLAWVDLSTGDWNGLFSKNQDELWQWAAKIAPKECIVPQGLEPPRHFMEAIGSFHRVPLQPFFDRAGAEEKILKAHVMASLTPLDLDDKLELVRACGAILAYLVQTQKADVSLGQFHLLTLNQHLIVDEVTERNLEIFQRLDGRKGQGTLWHSLDHTLTPMGGRFLQDCLKTPWRALSLVQAHQAVVNLFHGHDELRTEVRQGLKTVFDLERLCTRIRLNRCTPKDFAALRETLKTLPGLRNTLKTCPKFPVLLADVVKTWDDLSDVCAELSKAIVDNPPLVMTEGGLFRTGYDRQLDELLELTDHGEARLEELLRKEQTANNLPKLKLGFNRVFGYYFELSRTVKDEIPVHFIRKQTLANAERYLTEELKELEEKILSAAERRKNLEFALFQRLRTNIVEHGPRLMAQAALIAQLDFWQGLAQAARVWDWVAPNVHDGLTISIKGGRHPAVEAVQGRASFIPNDLSLQDDGRVLIITGPNMAGKSTVLRQAAIICLLAQIGSFVPAEEASLGIADRLFSRVGASDNLAQGQSTFMVEMTETARILRQCTKRSFVILDEIGRGTSTFDGMALAWAVVEELAARGEGGVRTLFATHYHELTNLEGKIPSVRNVNIAVKEWKGEIVFLRRLVPGPSDRSYGIEVAKLAGVPQHVVRKAKEILAHLEEKSRELQSTAKSAPATARPMLPGLAIQRTEPEPHPLLKEIYKINPLELTPLQALNLLSRWKTQWGSHEHNKNAT